MRDPYQELFDRVKAGESLTVAVGVDVEADLKLDAVRDTEPGLYRCFLRDGEPMMEPVARVVTPQRYYPGVVASQL